MLERHSAVAEVSIEVALVAECGRCHSGLFMCLNMNGDDVECLQHKGASVEWDGTIAYHDDSERES